MCVRRRDINTNRVGERTGEKVSSFQNLKISLEGTGKQQNIEGNKMYYIMSRGLIK